jgi:hypothetical protein
MCLSLTKMVSTSAPASAAPAKASRIITSVFPPTLGEQTTPVIFMADTSCKILSPASPAEPISRCMNRARKVSRHETRDSAARRSMPRRPIETEGGGERPPPMRRSKRTTRLAPSTTKMSLMPKSRRRERSPILLKTPPPGRYENVANSSKCPRGSPDISRHQRSEPSPRLPKARILYVTR